MAYVTVSSSATKAFAPDVVNFDIHITRVSDNTRELIDYNKTTIERIVDFMRTVDVSTDNLRENYFRIGINKENVDGKYVNNGFKLDSNYTIYTYIDYETIDDIRNGLADMDLEFDITYTIEDEEELRAGLLEDAVKKSYDKARIIAKAGDMQVGDMIEVNYSDNSRAPMMLRASAHPDAAPRDIEMTESVEVKWDLIS